MQRSEGSGGSLLVTLDQEVTRDVRICFPADYDAAFLQIAANLIYGLLWQTRSKYPVGKLAV